MAVIKVVTSLAEVWIEMPVTFESDFFPLVTSLAEVWIEITRRCRNITDWIRHFPCGSVD